MLAVRLHEEGDPDLLRVEQAPDPVAGPGEALVAVDAAALNHLDVWVRRGLPSVPKPRILGADGVGRIVALGDGVSGHAIGDRVCVDPTLSCGGCAACLAGEQPLCPALRVLGEHVDGTHAELVAVPARSLHPVPNGLTAPEAASFGLVFATAWRMLITRARLRAGEWVLVWGVGGGVATAALQIARASGAHVIATSGTPAKLERARELGAEVLIDHGRDDVAAGVMAATGGRGADVVVEHVGRATWDTTIACAARGARIAVCGATTGGAPPARLHQIFLKHLSVLGSSLGSDADFRAVSELLGSRRFRPVVDSVMPLDRAADAHRRLEAGEQMGKIVLRVR